jgi:predicted enzyme related to lactoylglutathione lyase
MIAVLEPENQDLNFSVVLFLKDKEVTLSPVGELMEVILYVEDMDAQVSFYRDKLGLKVKYPDQSSDFSEEFWVEMNSGPCSLALHAGGKRRFGVDAPKIVFRVDDILAERQALIDQAVKLGEIRSAVPGVWVCDGEDPEGNKFSIESHE